MPTIVREDQDQLNATLTLNIAVADYMPAFKKELKTYQKKAHLKGFRKGKTPLTVVKKMFGKDILAQLINNIVGKEIDKYLKEEKIDILGSPIPNKDQEKYDFDINSLGDFEFKFDLGIAPKFEVEGLEEMEFERYNTIISTDRIDEGLNRTRKQAGEQKSVDDEIQAEDIIKLQADEMDGDRIKENGWASEFSVSYDGLTEEAKTIFDGKKKGDLVQFDIFNLEKDRDEKFVRKYFLDVNEDAEDNPEIGNQFQAAISDVTRLELPELNEEFFETNFGGAEEGVTNEEEARQKIEADIKAFYDRQADTLMYNNIKTALEEKYPLEFPEEFLKRWLLLSGNLPEGTSVEEETPNMIKGLNWTLIRGKLAERFELTVETEEIKAQFKQQVMSYFGGYSLGNIIDDYVDRMMENEEQVQTVYGQILSEKLSQALKDVVKVKNNDIDITDFEEVIKAENAKYQPEEETTIEAAENGDEAVVEDAEIIEDIEVIGETETIEEAEIIEDTTE